MKRFLLIGVCCILCVSYSVNAKEYKIEEIKYCEGQQVPVCDKTIDMKKDFDKALKNLECIKKAMRLAYCDLDNKPITGILKEYYENGNLKKEGSFKNGISDGLLKIYNEKGILEAEMNYEKGALNGLSKRYYDNGNLKGESVFKDNVSEISKEYYENGNIKEELFLEGKTADPKYKFRCKGKKYYESGSVSYEHDENDDFRAYYENGNLSGEGNMRNGTARFYYENGDLGNEIRFKDGKAISGYEYDRNGGRKEMTNAHLYNNFNKNLYK